MPSRPVRPEIKCMFKISILPAACTVPHRAHSINKKCLLPKADTPKKSNVNTFLIGTELSSEVSPQVLSRFPDLQINICLFPSHTVTYNGFIKRILPEYSDRIAQDSHLIPFSHLAEEPSEHLIPYMELYIPYYSSMYRKVNSFLEVSHNK